MVHFVSSPEAGVAELPLILQGITPKSTASKIGSGNITGLAKAVILGGAYSESDYQTMKTVVDRAALDHTPVWLRKDEAKISPPPGPEYGKHIAARVMELLKQLEEDGKLNGKDGQLYWY